MPRRAFRGLALLLPLTLAIALASAPAALSRSRHHKEPKPQPETAGSEPKDAAKPVQLGSYSDWGAYLAHGEKSKTCYALATPKERVPADLKRDPAYVFISSRPGENVHHEIAIVMGFPLKEDGAHAEVAGSDFALIAKGANAWIKNTADEPHFIDALKKGSKLVVKAASSKGHVTTDSYTLAGLSQALDRIDKECPEAPLR